MLTENLIHKVRKFFQQQRVIVPSNPVIVAVSGGIDSLALMHILWRLREPLKLDLHIATLDHGLRGEAGRADRAFVEEMADAWEIPCTGGRADVEALAQASRTSIETAARRARYAFLAEVARQNDAQVIITAHHADDQAETVLMRLIRGTGLAGLGGMSPSAPVPESPQLTLLRPLLDITKAELTLYCAENGLHPRHDATNENAYPFRNFIRLRVLPLLRERNPSIETTLSRVSETAQLDESFIHAQFEQQALPHLLHETGRMTISRLVFEGLHPALQRRCLAYMAGALMPDGDDHPQYLHIVHAVNIAIGGKVGDIAHFSGGVRLRVNYDVLVVEHEETPAETTNYPQMPQNLEVSLEIDNPLTIDGFGWTIYASELEGEGAIAVLHLPEGAQMHLRTRRAGDRFAPSGMRGRSRKLKDWLIDRKIPQAARDGLPLLIVNGEIAAILMRDHWEVSENFRKPTSGTRQIYFFVNSLCFLFM